MIDPLFMAEFYQHAIAYEAVAAIDIEVESVRFFEQKPCVGFVVEDVHSLRIVAYLNPDQSKRREGHGG